MAKITDYTKQTGTFLKATDVKDGSTAMIIGEAELVHNDTYNTDRLHIPIKLNDIEYTFDASKTNTRTIVAVLGDETKSWIGKSIVLEKYKTKTSDGKMTDAINIKAVKA